MALEELGEAVVWRWNQQGRGVPKMSGCTLEWQYWPGHHLQLFLVPHPWDHLSFPGREGAVERGSAEPMLLCLTQHGSSALYILCVWVFFQRLGLTMVFMYYKMYACL